MARDLTTALEALDAGNWDRAHEIVQADCSPEAAWIHAHLHRLEGDRGNADYWYNRANRPHARGSLQEERDEIKRQIAH
ncbi:hypothetical protein U0C82_11605 [Fulvimarina sp. 2208YS6-2-32]|uniref:Uncharacterized protein n=1 Tax=Fulvimarina uroteuthidis TaxID=3098149 RepID=A0ABU5I345_9HYPH|nr:hypothetical protein [Fulvimarina sp. 2208YS6-2-32]MDY8109785.1 hypothetical protein [Fulvimarina sp. 2208YS6-2-32]